MIKSRLARKQLIYVFFCSTIFAVIVACYQLYVDYRKDVDEIHKQFDVVERSYVPSVVSSIYNYDNAQLNILLLGMSELHGIEYLEVSVREFGKSTVFASAGDPDAPRDISKSYDVVYEKGGDKLNLGKLIVYAGLKQARSRLIDRAIVIVSTNFIKAFLMALCILWIVHALIIRHLTKIADFTKHLSLNSLNAKLSLDEEVPVFRIGNKIFNLEQGDEIDQVVDAIDIMKNQLSDALVDLRESEQRFRSIFDGSEVSIWDEDFSDVFNALQKLREDGVTDLRDYLNDHEKIAWAIAGSVKVLHVNEATLRLFGARGEKELASRIDTTFGADAIEVFKDQLCAIWEQREIFRSEAEFKTLDGRIINGIISMPIPKTEEELRSVPVSIIDITESKKLEAQLRQSQRMDAVGQLAGGIAHDFNNVLGIVIGNLELLKHRVSDDPKAAKFIDAALGGGKRATALTRQLLDFARSTGGEPKPTNVNTFIVEMKNLIAKSLMPTVAVETRLDEDIWTVRVDPNDLENALVNMAINASHAMPKGGTLSIETRNEVLDEDYARSTPGCVAGEYVEISISDTGTGMTPEIVDQIFEPFFSTKDVGKGTGLGLSIVYGFVQRSGGHIKVHSEPGKGSTFRLYFPRAIVAEGESIQGEPGREEAPARGRETILVVEDEAALLQVAVSFLSDLGYRVLTADDGRQALEQLHRHPEIDLVFSDVVLPGGIDGFDIAKEVLKGGPATKVLLTSGFTSLKNHVETFHDPRLDELSRAILKKPYTRSELAAALRGKLDAED